MKWCPRPAMNENGTSRDFVIIGQTWRTPPSLREVSNRYIRYVLATHNISQAARILGIGRTTLYRFLKNGTIQHYKGRSSR